MSKDNQNPKGYFISSIVGEGACFNGDIELTGLLRIDGDLIGTVKNDERVLIGSTGRIQGKIYSDTVIVGGVVKGEIYAQGKVVVLSSGLVLGNIYASKLLVEEGAILDGKGIVTQDESDRNKGSITSGTFKLDWDRLTMDSTRALGTGRS